MPAPRDRTLAAAGCILVYATLVGFTDNFVRVIADSAGLWQFHATRSTMALAVLGLAAGAMGWGLRPRNPRAVVARSAVHGLAMLIYFGALAFLPVAQVAAGLFTAPIFVLLISRLIYGHPIGPVRIVAVVVGFAGVMLVLGPSALSGASLAVLLPVVAGALYALGNVATREWCGAETAPVLLAGFFAALGVLGAIGMAVLALLDPVVPEGAAGFVLRGPTLPAVAFWMWTGVQAVGALVGVGLMIRAYQLTEAGRASVLEYMILPASALWGWILWGERLSQQAILGMAMIAAAGVMIALRARQAEAGAATAP